jgi:hypothetical protein
MVRDDWAGVAALSKLWNAVWLLAVAPARQRIKWLSMT